MGKIFLMFIYYVIIGFVAVIYKILGINPFARQDEGDTYWRIRQVSEEKPEYRLTLGKKV